MNACMICFDDENVVSQEELCSCKGHIHTECLETWIRSSSNSNPRLCSVCKTEFKGLELTMAKKTKWNHRFCFTLTMVYVGCTLMTIVIFSLIVSVFIGSMNAYSPIDAYSRMLFGFLISSACILSIFIPLLHTFISQRIPLYSVTKSICKVHFRLIGHNYQV